MHISAAGAAARADARAAPRASPMRREFLVNRNLLGVDRDVAARGEVLDDAVHHLARAADSRGDILDRKSTRLNSSHANISYAVVCLHSEPAVDVLQCQVEDLLREAAHLA